VIICGKKNLANLAKIVANFAVKFVPFVVKKIKIKTCQIAI
jgi:hypothetical protein